MIAGLPFKMGVRARIVVPVILLGLLILPGCEDSYSENLDYPLRTDLMVVGNIPEQSSTRLDVPGELDRSMDALAAKLKYNTSIIMDPNKLDPEQNTELKKSLEEAFGTPARPKVSGIHDDAEKEAQILKSAQLDKETLARGSVLFRRHCLHCHGLAGDGHGPTAPWVNPHPRDYRQGLFKFVSTSGGNARKPHRQDLLRTLKEGVEGTSMPSFALLPENELQELVSYVIHLSLRGQVEYSSIRDMLNGKEDFDIGRLIKLFWRQWQTSQDAMIVPAKSPDYEKITGAELQASIRKGYSLFTMSGVGAAGCIGCHRDYGRINDYRYDAWGTVVRPADLTSNVYRGGRRPIDIYWRIHSGITPSAMPEFAGAIKEEDVWHLVNFVRALPYPQMLPEDIRKDIYEPEKNSHNSPSKKGK